MEFPVNKAMFIFSIICVSFRSNKPVNVCHKTFEKPILDFKYCNVYVHVY